MPKHRMQSHEQSRAEQSNQCCKIQLKVNLISYDYYFYYWTSVKIEEYFCICNLLHRKRTKKHTPATFLVSYYSKKEQQRLCWTTFLFSILNLWIPVSWFKTSLCNVTVLFLRPFLLSFRRLHISSFFPSSSHNIITTYIFVASVWRVLNEESFFASNFQSSPAFRSIQLCYWCSYIRFLRFFFKLVKHIQFKWDH